VCNRVFSESLNIELIQVVNPLIKVTHKMPKRGHKESAELFWKLGQYQLKQRSDVHIARKLWHLFGVLAIIIIYHNVSRTISIQLITFVTCLSFALDILRRHLPTMNQALISVFRPIMRKHEYNSLNGTTYLLIGTSIVIFLFPKPIVTLSLLFLAIADPVAGYVGVLYGHDKIMGQKSLQGFIAAFISCTIIAAVYYFNHNLITDRILIVSIISGLIGAFSELIPIFKLDDNLTFPPISATCLWTIFYLFGGL